MPEKSRGKKNGTKQKRKLNIAFVAQFIAERKEKQYLLPEVVCFFMK